MAPNTNYNTVKDRHRCEQCNKSFKRKEHLDRHNASSVHNTNPTRYRCNFRLKANGEQCNSEVSSQAQNLKEHIEADHLNWTYLCKLCSLVLTRYTHALKHMKGCRHNHGIPESDKRHAIDFVVENSDASRALIPADPPEGWIPLKPHSVRIQERREKALPEAAAGHKGKGKGPSRLRTSRGAVNTSGTPVPSILHFNEVYKSITQSYETPGASSSTTPLHAGFIHPENQLHLPSHIFDDSTRDGDLQLSPLPSDPVKPAASAHQQRRVRRVRRRHQPYPSQVSPQPEPFERPSRLMPAAVPVPSQQVMPVQAEWRSPVNSYDGMHSNSDQLPTVPSPSATNPEQHLSAMSEVSTSEFSQIHIGLHLPTPDEQRSSIFPRPLDSDPGLPSLPQTWTCFDSSVHDAPLVDAQWSSESSPESSGSGDSLWSSGLTSTTISTTDNSSAATSIEHPLRFPSPEFGSDWVFNMPEHQRTEMSSVRDEQLFPYPSAQSPYDNWLQFQPLTSPEIRSSTSTVLPLTRLNDVCSQDHIDDDTFRWYGSDPQQ